MVVRRRFKVLGSYIDPRIDFTNPQYISIGKGTYIRAHTWIYAIDSDAERKGIFSPSIEIGDHCVIGRFCYITASNRIVIEDYAYIMEGVLITDSSHGYEDISVPIIRQPLVSKGPIIIKRGAWIGTGARIMGKLQIGCNSVVACNAVVTHDVPDYCVVAGVPAKIVKRYDPDTQRWVSVEHGSPVAS
jgi:acetyltransferase-like isoleucine patch superfamily enzyme